MDSAVEITKSSTVDPIKNEKNLSDFGFKKKSKKNKKSKNNNVSYMMKFDNLSTVDKIVKDEDDCGGSNINCLDKNCEELKERLQNAQKPNGILMNGDSNHFSEEYHKCHNLTQRCTVELNKVNIMNDVDNKVEDNEDDDDDDEDDDDDINSINSLSKKCANQLPEYLKCGYVPDNFHNHLCMDVELTSEFIKNDLDNPIATASTTATAMMATTHTNIDVGTDNNILKMTNNNNNNNNLFSNKNNLIMYEHIDMINNFVDFNQKIDLLAENTEKLTINNDLSIDKKNILCKYPEHKTSSANDNEEEEDDDDDEEEDELKDKNNKSSIVDTNTKIIHQVTSTSSNCKTGEILDKSMDGDNPSNSNDIEIIYKEYESELQMPDIIRLIQKDLSEPYSIYTYRYFIHNWPKLCFLAMYNDLCVGAIVCKLDLHHSSVKRGYIAMLAVDKTYRKMKIGTNLVQKAIQAMVLDNADEVVLETEITNTPALRLYENLGFVRDKRLFHYYLNGVDALRLKLWFR